MAKNKKPVFQWVEAEVGPVLASQHFPQIKPVSDGQMPLSAAVHWIASKGFKDDHDLGSEAGVAAYNSTANELFAKIASGKVRAVGEDGDENNDELRPIDFIGLDARFDFDLEDDSAGNTKRLEINVSENGKSRDVFLKASKRGKWTDIYVYCDGILSEWTFGVLSKKRISQGKQPKIIKYFVETFKGNPVPPPAEIPRGGLKADLLKWDPLLRPLDEDTIRKAIEAYNDGLIPK